MERFSACSTCCSCTIFAISATFQVGAFCPCLIAVLECSAQGEMCDYILWIFECACLVLCVYELWIMYAYYIIHKYYNYYLTKIKIFMIHNLNTVLENKTPTNSWYFSVYFFIFHTDSLLKKICRKFVISLSVNMLVKKSFGVLVSFKRLEIIKSE